MLIAIPESIAIYIMEESATKDKNLVLTLELVVTIIRVNAEMQKKIR